MRNDRKQLPMNITDDDCEVADSVSMHDEFSPLMRVGMYQVIAALRRELSEALTQIVSLEARMLRLGAGEKARLVGSQAKRKGFYESILAPEGSKQA